MAKDQDPNTVANISKLNVQKDANKNHSKIQVPDKKAELPSKMS